MLRGPPTNPMEEQSAASQEEGWESTVRKDILVGQQLGEYVVRRRIGSGGMGVVYEGEHPVIGRKVAIKIIRPDSSEGVRSRDLVSEARAASAIRHRGIIDIFGFGTLPGIGQYLVMEFLNGRPLDEVIMDRAPMPPAEVIRLITEVLGALSAAHAVGVIHRDLKPGNIFVVLESNGSEYVKVLDFGLAKQGATPNSATPQTRASMIVGTPEYMAPEQACGQPVSPRTDLYAVGIILFEMLTGRLPFRGDSPMHVAIQQVQAQPPSPASLVDGLPPELDALILRLLAKDPEQRYASAEVVARELKTIARTLAVEMTQLSGFARTMPDPEPPSVRPPARQEATAPRGASAARAPAPTPAPETLTAPRTAPAAASPAPARSQAARPQAARPQAARPQAPASRTPPTTDVIPVQKETLHEVQAPDTAELEPAGRSKPGMKLAVGIILVALLAGAGVGLAMLRDESGPAVPPGSDVTVSKGPPPRPTVKEPPPPPVQEPRTTPVAPPQQTETHPTEPQPGTGTPEQNGAQATEQNGTQTSAQNGTQAPDETPQKPVTASSVQNPKPGVKPRIRKEPGVLQIVAKCWAPHVYVDGKDFGKAPIPSLTLAAGRHKIELQGNPSIKEPVQYVTIRPGEPIERVFECVKAAD